MLNANKTVCLFTPASCSATLKWKMWRRWKKRSSKSQKVIRFNPQCSFFTSSSPLLSSPPLSSLLVSFLTLFFILFYWSFRAPLSLTELFVKANLENWQPFFFLFLLSLYSPSLFSSCPLPGFVLFSSPPFSFFQHFSSSLLSNFLPSSPFVFSFSPPYPLCSSPPNSISSSLLSLTSSLYPVLVILQSFAPVSLLCFLLSFILFDHLCSERSEVQGIVF